MRSLAAAPGVCQPCGRLGGIFPFLFRSSCVPEQQQLPDEYRHDNLFVRVRGGKARGKTILMIPKCFGFFAVQAYPWLKGMLVLDSTTSAWGQIPLYVQGHGSESLFLPLICGCRWAHTAFFLCVSVTFWTLLCSVWPYALYCLQRARKRNNRMILMSMRMMNLQLQLHFNPSKFSHSRDTFPQWHSQVCLLCQVHQGCLQVRGCVGYLLKTSVETWIAACMISNNPSF